MYLARKGNVQFYVQNADIENYANEGYTILTADEEKEVTDVTAETFAAGSAQISITNSEIGEG